jgi:hypothetical protein
MVYRNKFVLLVLFICLCYVHRSTCARGGGRRGKGKGKNLLPFGNIAEYSLVKEPEGLSPGVSWVYMPRVVAHT